MRADLPRITVGQGPPLVVLLFTPQAANPTGLARWSAMRMLKPFTERFTVHLLNRPPGLAPDTTMAELAAVYAGGFDGPARVLGVSTGGSVAQQLAADRPDLVERLVLAGTAGRLGPIGKRTQRAYVDRARQGRRPSPALAELVTPSPLARRLLSGLLWLSDGSADHSDAATMLNAEDGFDLLGRLADIKAPTLLIHGENDVVYPLELARRTAEGIPGARLIVYPGKSHSATFTDRRFALDALTFLT
ncbi:alpha/beta fold hydrolase [Nonomuraea endophytica]|uniref:Pimeloyl-ACP methyl ester carboxylesterase n=1 Tax=Nonomuraea endophytica TaxID=714136 RepID=A0A7W8AF11_9ACTN|nr:alpha/beta fold hydrolase [Nonomuraea endophytica]MBB5083871.1 pimeloyl-ACP methyl ester carboxylesterase [Nonomuraea endophytica]